MLCQAGELYRAGELGENRASGLMHPPRRGEGMAGGRDPASPRPSPDPALLTPGCLGPAPAGKVQLRPAGRWGAVDGESLGVEWGLGLG